jgi:uncharacterized protein
MTARFATRRLGAASVAILLLAAALIAACSSGNGTDENTPGEPLTILAADGSTVHLRAEVADTPNQRREGLMGRTKLAPDSGMLFVIEPPGRGFWMKDTTLALTVAFIGECGEIVAFADLDPLSEEVKNTERPYTFALEMEQGWFAANGVAVGDAFQLPRRLLPDGC